MDGGRRGDLHRNLVEFADERGNTANTFCGDGRDGGGGTD